MPEGTLDAVADHGVITGDTVTEFIRDAQQAWEQLEGLGIERLQVCDVLEADGVQSFIDAWVRLRETVQTAMDASAS